GWRWVTVGTSVDDESPEAIAATVVRAEGSRIIYLRALAHTSLAETLPGYRARLNGEQAVFLAAVQRKGSQIFQVRDGMETVLQNYQQNRLPGHIRLDEIGRASCREKASI